jgi:hypothetical protein
MIQLKEKAEHKKKQEHLCDKSVSVAEEIYRNCQPILLNR